MAKVKSSQFVTYLNVTPESPHVLGSALATYALLGPGVTKADIGLNPEITEEQFIGEDSGSSSLDAYGPTMPIEQIAILGDPVFNFVDQLRLDLAILGDAETDLINVELYETPISPGVYPASQHKVAILIGDFGDAAGSPIVLPWTGNYVGTHVRGSFTVATGVFAAT